MRKLVSGRRWNGLYAATTPEMRFDVPNYVKSLTGRKEARMSTPSLKSLLMLLILAFCIIPVIGESSDDRGGPPVGSRENPICVNGVYMSKLYLRTLRTSAGKPLAFERVRSVPKGPHGNILDLYEADTPDGKGTFRVYVDMYHPDVQSLPKVAPRGLVTLEQFEAAKLRGKIKKYVNFSLPGGAKFCPIVVQTDEGETIVARVAFVDGKRDIQVLRRSDESWSPLGQKGQALTGVGGNFLTDAVFGPDGRAWVLAEYSVPSNPERGGKCYLYCYRDGAWTLRCVGQVGTAAWGSGLHFLGGHDPVRIFCDGAGGLQILRLEGRNWVSVPVKNALQKLIPTKGWYPEVSKTGKSTWFIWKETTGRQSVLKALCVKWTGKSDILAPVKLESWDKRISLKSAAASAEGTIAVLIDERWRISDVGRRYRRDGDKYVTSALPSLGKRTENEVLKWSPKGVLYAAWCPRGNTQRLELVRLDEKAWVKVATVSQPKKDGAIFGPRIFFDK